MKIEMIQQFLFKVIAEITNVDIEVDDGFETFLSMLETVVSNTTLIDVEAGNAIRNIIDTEWDKYQENIEKIPEPEYGENVIAGKRDREKTLSAYRREFVDTIINEIVNELAQRCVIA